MQDYVELDEWQVREIAKCMRSPEYFVQTYCWLQQKAIAGSVDAEVTIPFEMGWQDGEHHYFQRQILRWLHNRDNVVAYKDRRVGCSWIASAYVAWLINFHEGANVLFISITGKDARKILEKVKFILNNLALHDAKSIKKATSASWLRGETGPYDNQEEFSIQYRNDDGTISSVSTVLSLTNTDDSGRGDDASFIIFDELGFYEHDEETWSSAKKATALGGHWMAISTPNLVGGVHHRLVSRGELYMHGELDEDINFKYTGYIKYTDAGITEEQVARASEGDTQEKIAQEWGGQFISMGTVAFDPTHLAVCYKPPSQYPEIAAAIEDYHRKVMAEKNAGQYMYYSGADTSVAKTYRKKTEKDYHAFTALTSHGIQVGTYASKEALSKWAGKVVDDGAGRRVEIVGTLSKLHAKYPGIMYAEEDGPGHTAINQHQLPKDVFSELVPTSMRHQTKMGIIERLILKVEHHLIVITDYFTYQCMLVFQSLGVGKYGAPSGYFDDPVIVLALANAALDKYGMTDQVWGTTLERQNAGGIISPLQQEGDIPIVSGTFMATDIPIPSYAMRTSEIAGGDLGMPGIISADELSLYKTIQGEDDKNFEMLTRRENYVPNM